MIEIQKQSLQLQKPNLIALSSQEAQWLRLALATNNLANANTPGFKGQMVQLSQVAQRGKEDRLTHYVSANRSLRNLSDGAFRLTGNPLDIAISGRGYFMVETPQGNRLTRNGQFTLNADGQLVTANGSFKVLNENGSPISVPKTMKKMIVQSQGGVYADSEYLGKLGVYEVDDQQQKLKNIGSNLLDPGQQTPQASKNIQVKQFGVEDSNVSSIKESLLLIEFLRQYEHAQKVIDEYEQSNKKMLGVSSRNV